MNKNTATVSDMTVLRLWRLSYHHDRNHCDVYIAARRYARTRDFADWLRMENIPSGCRCNW